MSTSHDRILSPDQLAGLACVVCGCAPKVALPLKVDTPTSTHVFRCESCSVEQSQVERWVDYSMAHVIVVGYPRDRLAGMLLQGPRAPEDVRSSGYGFTRSVADAWPFASAKQAAAKARIVDKHMGWGEGVLVVETRSEAATNAASEPAR